MGNENPGDIATTVSRSHHPGGHEDGFYPPLHAIHYSKPIEFVNSQKSGLK